MKKSLIALAALAAVSAASAQSTVTISGGYGLAFGTSKVGADSSGLQIARQTGNIQFAGSEDLGGGLKAGFALQTAIGSIATTNSAATPGVANAATAPATLGDRAAYVTLGGDFGTFFLGRGNTATRSLWGALVDTPLPVVSGITAGSSSASGVGLGDKAARVIYGDTFSNYVAYSTPTISGFTGIVALAPTQATTSVTATAAVVQGANIGNNDLTKDTMSYTLQYGNGPIAAAVNITDVAQTNGYKQTTLFASYDLGMAKVGVATQTITLNAGGTDPANGTAFTLSAPLGSGVAVFEYGKRGASDSAASLSTTGFFGDDVKQTVLGYRYNFSKRTNLNLVYNKIDRAGTDYDLKETHLIVGHTF